MLPDRVEAVLFDAGGTLVTLDYPFIAGLARRRGCQVEPGALPAADARARLHIDRAVRGDSRRQGRDDARRPAYFSTLLEALGIRGDLLAELVDDLERAHRRDNLWRLAQPGALETLRGLRSRGVRTAVVSNADGRVAAVLEGAGLAEHLELIVDSHLEGVEKPEPEIFHRALARMSIGAGRSAYVGDIYAIDAVGARAAGLVPVILDPTGSFGPLDCAKIASLGELLDALGPPQRGDS